MPKRTRNLIIVAGGLVALVIISIVASHARGEDRLSVPVQKVALATFVVKLPENGVVMRPRAQTIPTLIAGNIAQIYVKAGDTVRQGQLLATIDNPALMYQAQSSQADYGSAVANVSAARVQEENARVGYQAAVASDKAALDDAKRVYDEDVQLLANKAIPRNQLDTDRTKLEQAQVAYDQAVEQARLGAVSGFNGNSVQYAAATAQKMQILNAQNQQQVAFTRVLAPFDGTIQTVATEPNDALRSLQPGDAVTAGQAVFTIAGGGGFIVKAQVDEQDIINVRIGQRANITGQDFPGKVIAGHVATIAPVATKSTDATSTAKQVLTTIALDASPGFLKDGMTADVDILTTYLPHAVVVPNDAVVKEGAASYVYVVEGGVAHKRRITAGKRGDTQTQVAAGLRPGESIVTTKVPELKDGAPVTAASPSPSPSPVTT
jgi:RND family efflux transporter MFP subunit